MATPTGKEKRQHLRINTLGYIQFELLLQNDLSQRDQAERRLFTATERAQFDLWDTIETHRETTSHLLSKTSSDSQLNNVIQYLESIPTLLKSLSTKAFSHHSATPVWVNLSMGGLAFHHNASLPLNQFILCKLTLPSDNTGFVLLGRTVSCNSQPRDRHYRISVQFDSLSEKDQTRLNQYILKQQATLVSEKSA